MRWNTATLVAIVLVGAAIRSFRLGHQSLWTDEILTPLSSSGSVWHVMTQTTINTNIPPLYYLVVHLVMPFGQSEWLLRLPSMVFGAGSVALFFFVVREWFATRVALTCAALLAVSPFQIWYSQEARPYALFLFLSLLSLRLLQRLIARPENRWRQFWFVLSAASVFYCHTLAIPFLAFLATYVVLGAPRETWMRMARLFVAIGILLVPAVYRLMVFTPNASADATRSLGVIFVPYALWTFATGYSIGPTLTQLHLPTRVTTAIHSLPLVIPIALLIGALASTGAVALWRRARKEFWIAALWFGLPLAFAIVGTLITTHPFNARYITLALPPFLLVVTLGALAPRRAVWRVALLMAIAVVSAISLRNYFFEPRYFREDNRAAGAYLAANARPGDLVIADAPYTMLNLAYYAQRPDLAFIGYPSPTTPVPTGAAGVRRSGAAPSPNEPADTAHLDQVIGPRHRFWVFLSRTFHGVPAATVLAYCDTRFRRVRQLATPNDILLVLYEARPD